MPRYAHRTEPAGESLIDINSAGGTPSSPDVSGNFWSAITTIGSGVALVNETNNAPTGAIVTVTRTINDAGNGFTGGLVETGPASGNFNIAQAYQDGWYDNANAGSVATFSFTNLNPTSTYALTLWGNRDVGWTDVAVSVTAGKPPAREVPTTLTANTQEVTHCG